MALYTRKTLKTYWPIPLSIVVFSLLLSIDQYTKHVISTGYTVGQQKAILPWLWFTYAQNTGANWGTFQGQNTAFILLSVVAFVLLIYFSAEFITVVDKLCYALLMAGLWGNLLDRLAHGFVVDFLDLGWFPIFNIADAAICVGIGVYLFHQWRKEHVLKIPQHH